MSLWWYYTTHKCTECGTTWTEYDPKGGNYDSGVSGPVLVEELCQECAEQQDPAEDFTEDQWEGEDASPLTHSL